MQEFIKGRPAVYSGFNGALYIATYTDGEKNRTGVGSLKIQNSRGKVIRNILMASHSARSFFWNLDAEAAS